MIYRNKLINTWFKNCRYALPSMEQTDTPNEQIRSLSNYVQQYTTSAIGCYCTGCIEGIKRMKVVFSCNEVGGINAKRLEPIHIASLLAQAIKLS